MRFLLPCVLLVVSGCIKRAPQGDASTVGIAPARWVGNLTPVVERTGELRVAGQARIHGEAELTQGRSDLESLVQMSFSAPAGSDEFAWGLHTGRCGSGTPAVVPVNNFPLIQARNGKGEARAYVPIRLPVAGNYHVNLFANAGGQLTDVVACANLRPEPLK